MYIPLGDPRENCWENHFPFISLFWNPNFGAQKVPGPKCHQLGPDLAPGSKNIKDARRKMMQNPAGINSNGAMRCKLWPKTILGGNP